MTEPAPRRYAQVDVFTATALRGNPLAVVVDAQGLDDERMAAIARWTNLSETTFLLPPTDPQADYRVRIWTPGGELPFAGHPTLGSCHVWLAHGGRARARDRVVQQCGVGRVPVRIEAADPGEVIDGVGRGRLSFAAPPLRRSGPVDAAVRAQVAAALRLPAADLLRVNWVDNGPGWIGVWLADAAAVRGLAPDFAAMRGLKVGVAGPQPAGGETAIEVRAFVPSLGVPEDPVTGSLNAGLAQWLIGDGLLPARYVAAQGGALRREGRVHVRREADGTVLIGGDVTDVIRGTIGV